MTEREKHLYWLNYAKQNAKMERLARLIMARAISSSLRPVIASLESNGLEYTISMLDSIFPKLLIQEAYSEIYLQVGQKQKAWADADVKSRFGKKAQVLELLTKDEEDDRYHRRPIPQPQVTPTFGIGFENPLWLARLRNLITGSEVGQRVTSVTKTIGNRIKQSLLESSQQFVSMRKTIAKLRRDVDDPYVRSRAELIARTEVTYVSNLAQEQAATEIAAEVGIDLMKVWIRTIDNRTRDTHYNAPREAIKADEKFKIGGKKMDKPGDPAGGLREVINCRCVVSYLPADDHEDLLDADGNFQEVPYRPPMDWINGY
jgi:hypothetical protein